MVKKRKKKDSGESLPFSTSSDSDCEDSAVLQEANTFAPFRVAHYYRRYPEDAEAKSEFIVFVESTNDVPLSNRDMMSLSTSFMRSVKDDDDKNITADSFDSESDNESERDGCDSSQSEAENY